MKSLEVNGYPETSDPGRIHLSRPHSPPGVPPAAHRTEGGFILLRLPSVAAAQRQVVLCDCIISYTLSFRGSSLDLSFADDRQGHVRQREEPHQLDYHDCIRNTARC